MRVKKGWSNVGFIYQPHYMTNCARVACCDQRGTKLNYVVICCSELYNGVYSYDASLTKEFNTWVNGKLPCYEIPMEKLTFERELDGIKDSGMRSYVKGMQKSWWKGQIKNGKAHKTDFPDWIID